MRYIFDKRTARSALALLTVLACLWSVPAKQGGAAPLPRQKPGLSQPDVMQLLSFGQPPVPKSKPQRAQAAPLAGDDATLYKEIFAAQARAEWDKADRLMGSLKDLRLRGHVLSQRYLHPTAYKADFEELASWMDSYADYPDADKIYSLAVKRKPAGFKGSIRKPAKNEGINGYIDVLAGYEKPYRSPKTRTETQIREIERIQKAIRKELSAGERAQAYKRLQDKSVSALFDAVEYDLLRAEIANSYMMAGEFQKANALALASVRRSGANAPLAGWVGGLIAWQEGRYAQAASLFEQTARSPYSSEWAAAGGAYWASRAHMRAGNVDAVSLWLREAAEHPRTFYGLIATRALGWDFDFNWDMPKYTADDKALLMKNPAARRAMLLVKAGQYHLAEAELRGIDPRGDKNLSRALLAYAGSVGLPSYSMRLAATIQAPDGKFYDAALYPVSPWKPQNGYKVDEALLYALIRQESKFDPSAQSQSGATGLMQLMPATASFISGEADYKSREGRHSLKEPQVNLDLGQRYVENLLNESHIGTELFSLVIAYNAGPGNLKKWKESYRKIQNDPLLFIEMIPMGETRTFVERVMANYWIYRLRMKRETPSLDAVAEGRWALYAGPGVERQALLETNPSAKPF